mgnify:CR=1 FL=1
MRRLKNISRNINKNPNVNRFLDMSRQRRKTNGKANNSNLVGLVATVTNVENVNVGKRVVIQEVNNDIAKVFLLDDKKMNKFYLPVSDLHPFSRERSQEYLLESVIDGFMGIVNKVVNGDEDWRKHARSNADNAQPPKKEPKDLTDDSERNYSNHILEGGDLIVKCSKFCRDYKVSPIYFISQLSEHLYAMHERYAPKDKK